MIIIPLLLAGVFIINTVIDKNQAVNNMQEAESLLILSVASSNLVHELQKERGATAVYLGSQGKKFSQKLTQQRQLTDDKKELFNKVLMQTDSEIIATSNSLLTKIKQQLNEQVQIRNSITSLSIESRQALGYYTQLNSNILDITASLAELVTDKDISRKASAYYYFLQGKERAGIERAVLSHVFSKDNAKPNEKARYISLAVEQSRFIQIFKDFSSKKKAAMLDSTLDTPANEEVMAMRQIAWNNSSGFSIDAAVWFDKSTQRINSLKKSEDNISSDIANFVGNKKDQEYSSFILLILTIIIIFLLSLLISYKTQQLIQTQLKKLSEGMTALGEDSNLQVYIEPSSKDDLGRLTVLFNSTVGHIHNLVTEMKSAGTSLQEAASSLTEVSSQVGGQINQGLQQTDIVASSVSEMGKAVQDIAHNCATAATEAEETNGSAQVGSTILEQAAVNMQQLNATLLETRDTIEDVAKNSSEIGSILDVIKSIAEQTNLLALNAAIEAARAGDQGRGFAVVADEVRTLAQRTQESTTRIEEMISSLQQGSQKAVNAMSISEEKSKATNESIENIQNQINIIIGQVTQVNDLNTQSAAATEEQAVTVNDINENISSIQSRYRKNQMSMETLSDTVQQIDQLADKLNEHVNHFKMS